MNPRKLSIGDLAQLLNSSPAGPVTTEPALRRHRTLAGFRIGDGKSFDLVRYIAWLFWETHTAASGSGYEAVKERARARAAQISVSGRDIGEIPKPRHRKRRRRAERSFRHYCEDYFPGTFSLSWSPDHLKAIAKIESAVLRGGLFAFAMPRGGGKTSLCEIAALWAISTGRRHFVALVGSEATSAGEMLDSIKSELENNPRLVEGFPEICYPIGRLGGIAQRANGQLHHGLRTHIGWKENVIVLPTIAGSAASGAIIKVAGITGRIRGMKHKRASGKSDRPDLVIIDDPQTRESAQSDVQTQQRLATIKADIVRLAGPGKRIAGFMPCTVIRRGDLADQVLDREKYPQWQGERMKMVYAFPKDEKLWADYAKILVDDIRAEQGMARATEFYRANRAAMDLGAAVGWEARYEPGEISAVQNAMDQKILDPDVFWAEFQNEPQEINAAPDRLTSDQIIARVNRHKRGVIPVQYPTLAAFIDVQLTCLPWMVVAWGEGFGGAVPDYGLFPDPARVYWTVREVTRTLARRFPGTGKEGSIYAGLEALTGEILGREWPVDSGGVARVKLCLVDASWGDSTDIVLPVLPAEQVRADPPALARPLRRRLEHADHPVRPQARRAARAQLADPLDHRRARRAPRRLRRELLEDLRPRAPRHAHGRPRRALALRRVPRNAPHAGRSAHRRDPDQDLRARAHRGRMEEQAEQPRQPRARRARRLRRRRQHPRHSPALCRAAAPAPAPGPTDEQEPLAGRDEPLASSGTRPRRRRVTGIPSGGKEGNAHG